MSVPRMGEKANCETASCVTLMQPSKPAPEFQGSGGSPPERLPRRCFPAAAVRGDRQQPGGRGCVAAAQRCGPELLQQRQQAAQLRAVAAPRCLRRGAADGGVSRAHGEGWAHAADEVRGAGRVWRLRRQIRLHQHV